MSTYCSIIGCFRAAKVKGMCQKHYHRQWREGKGKPLANKPSDHRPSGRCTRCTGRHSHSNKGMRFGTCLQCGNFTYCFPDGHPSL